MKPDFIKVLGLKPRLAKYENHPILSWVIDQEEFESALEEKCLVMYYRHNSGKHEYFQLPEHNYKAFVFGQTEIVKERLKVEIIETVENWSDTSSMIPHRKLLKPFTGKRVRVTVESIDD